MRHLHSASGIAQRHDGVRSPRQPEGHIAVGGIASIPLGTNQFLRAVFVNRQIRRLAAVGQHKMAAAAQLCSICNGLALFLGSTFSILDSVGHFFRDRGGTGSIHRGVFRALVYLIRLNDLIFDRFHIRFIDHFFLHGNRGTFRHQISFNGLNRHSILTGVHIFRQSRTGFGIHRVVGGFALRIRQGHCCFHTGKRQFFRGIFPILCSRRCLELRCRFFRLFRQCVQLNAHVLLHHAHVRQQLHIRFRCRFRCRSRSSHRFRRRGGRCFRGRHRRERSRKHTQADACRQHGRRTAGNQFV